MKTKNQKQTTETKAIKLLRKLSPVVANFVKDYLDSSNISEKSRAKAYKLILKELLKDTNRFNKISNISAILIEASDY